MITVFRQFQEIWGVIAKLLKEKGGTHSSVKSNSRKEFQSFYFPIFFSYLSFSKRDIYHNKML